MKAEREEMWKRQQEILAERRSGSGKAIREAEKRRERVRKEVRCWIREVKELRLVVLDSGKRR